MNRGSSFNLQPSPRRPRPLILRITSLRNPNVLSNFYTLDFVPSATHSESTTSPLFEKQRGVHPPKAKSRRNLRQSNTCCCSRRHSTLPRATHFRDPAILRSRINLNQVNDKCLRTLQKSSSALSKIYAARASSPKSTSTPRSLKFAKPCSKATSTSVLPTNSSPTSAKKPSAARSCSSSRPTSKSSKRSATSSPRCSANMPSRSTPPSRHRSG